MGIQSRNRRNFIAGARQVGRLIARGVRAGIRITRQRRLQRIKDGELRGSVSRRHGRVAARGRAYKAVGRARVRRR